MYKELYQKFRNANPEVQHYAAHSHHYWPDVTFDAMIAYWNDSAKYVDEKWDYIFGTKVPQAQNLIASILNLDTPEQIVFAPNTHEFVVRLLSCFERQVPIRVLTTDSEFYSFERQVNRLAENGSVQVTKIPTEPLATFEERFNAEIKRNSFDLIFFSHVFFNSGVVVDVEKIVQAVGDAKTMIVVDGYHGFMAIPTNLQSVQDRIFYIAGSYKYAQGGEGCCFMTVPKNSAYRPQNTGWFAGFDSLSEAGGGVTYPNTAMRFAGSTMDFSALYRLIAVLDLFAKREITVGKIHAHVQKLQARFLESLKAWNHPNLQPSQIVHRDLRQHGHFFAFEMGQSETAKLIHTELKNKKILTDFRKSRLRFGFGIYQNDTIEFAR